MADGQGQVVEGVRGLAVYGRKLRQGPRKVRLDQFVAAVLSDRQAPPMRVVRGDAVGVTVGKAACEERIPEHGGIVGGVGGGYASPSNIADCLVRGAGDRQSPSPGIAWARA